MTELSKPGLDSVAGAGGGTGGAGVEDQGIKHEKELPKGLRAGIVARRGTVGMVCICMGMSIEDPGDDMVVGFEIE